jgi:hypothetical protein
MTMKYFGFNPQRVLQSQREFDEAINLQEEAEKREERKQLRIASAWKWGKGQRGNVSLCTAERTSS